MLRYADPGFIAANVRVFNAIRAGYATGDREIFLRALANAQALPLSCAQEPRISFEDDELGKILILRGMLSEVDRGATETLGEDERTVIQGNIRDAIASINTTMPDLTALINLLISDLVCIRSNKSEGGTASNLLGVIWVSPPTSWTTIDFVECLIHETIHNCVFLLDMIHQLYRDSRTLENEETFVVSAIRREPRAIDKSLHSACVSAALMEMNTAFGYEEKNPALLEPLITCVNGLRKKESFLSEFGRDLLHDLESHISSQKRKLAIAF